MGIASRLFDLTAMDFLEKKAVLTVWQGEEELLEELEYRRAEMAYLKKLDALIQQKKLAQQKKQK